MMIRNVYTTIVLMAFYLLTYSGLVGQHISGGNYHSLTICTDGSVRSCGNNNFGELGDSTTLNQSTPVITGLPPGANIQKISGGVWYTLFLNSNGTTWACGNNSFGQLGDSTNLQREIPVQVNFPVGTVIKDISAGGHHSLFLKDDGTVWGCGWNDDGQLGDTIAANKLIPTQMNFPLGTIITDIAAGYSFSLFLKDDGTVWSCGNNTYGQLGDSSTIVKKTPVQVIFPAGTIISKIFAGSNHALFIENDGSVWVCGNNTNGQLGDGTYLSKIVPVQVIFPLGTHIISATGETTHSVFLKDDGTAWSCGKNDFGQLGNGTTTDTNRVVQVNFSAGTNISEIEAGWLHSLFLKDDGTVWACGYNNGQLGDGTFINSSIPVQMNTCMVSIGIPSFENEKKALHIFPNPFSDQATLQMDQSLKNASVIIYNPWGKNIREIKNICGQTIVLDRNNLPGGLYFLCLMQDHKILGVSKIVVND